MDSEYRLLTVRNRNLRDIKKLILVSCKNQKTTVYVDIVSVSEKTELSSALRLDGNTIDVASDGNQLKLFTF